MSSIPTPVLSGSGIRV